LLALATGCDAVEPATMRAEDAVKGKLRDPSSAQFRNVHLNKIDSNTVCGEVNAKNAFGGYAGYMRFAAEADGQKWRIMLDDGSLDTEGKSFFATLWQGCE
jgi:hypothetical protein